jgi:hypothetical protein
LFATDILKVLYAPHKVFKQITQNPKYWGPLLIIILFAALQTGLYYSQYSRTYYEETYPKTAQVGGLLTTSQLTAWTDSPTLWVTTPAASVTSNVLDIMNTTFYGNSSLQFEVTNSSSLSLKISNLNGSINCGPDGFQDLYLQIKIVQPAGAPSNATLQLFSGTSSYFQTDLTSTLSNETAAIWNNLTIPVGQRTWQSMGTPSWTNISGIQLNLSYPEASNMTVRMGGLFFRGLYETPIESIGIAGFTASILFSGLFTFIIQWLALSVVFFLILKLMKAPATWKPIFISIAFALVTLVVETLILLAGTATLPAQIHYPFEFTYSFQLTYTSDIVSMFSAASQAVYNSVISVDLSTLTLLTTIVAIGVYVWITLIGSTIIRAITEFTWTKSILTSAASVVLSYIILSLLAAIGLV